jgi:acetyl esterase
VPDTSQSHDFEVDDIEYLRHGDTPLLARVYRPQVAGPTAAVVEIHGGAWSKFDRTRGVSVHEALARRGVFVMAIDFRQGAEGAYPLMLQDINYAIRWLKANAERFGIDPDRVGLSGNSTGGHTAMLTAMRPDDPRYDVLDLPDGLPTTDATVRCVVMLWPVINPIGRYRYAKSKLDSDDPPEWVGMILPGHDEFWGGEDAMAEGSPTFILERGEEVCLPPALWIQATQDSVHNYINPASGLPESEDFTARYRAAGGEIDLTYFDAPMMFTTAHPTLPESIAALDHVADFVVRWTQ